MEQAEHLQEVLGRLKGVRKAGNGYMAKCPCRKDDDNPSLSISTGEDDRILVHCHRATGCGADEICNAMGLEVGDLFPYTPKDTKAQLVETYPYTNADGELLFEVCRYWYPVTLKKTFRGRKPDGFGGYYWSLGDIERPLYRLPEIIQAVQDGKKIIVAEGEKDVDTLFRFGRIATTNPHGAGKWRHEHTQVLAGADVDVVADRDEVGLQHAISVARDLLEAGCTVRVFQPPEPYKDITELIQATDSVRGLVLVDINNLPLSEMSRLVREIGDIEAKTELDFQTKLSKIRRLVDSYQPSNVRPGRLVPWEDFFKESVDDSYNWVIEGLMERRERVIVVAPEGAGKSFLARQVALCVGAGIHPFHFGRIESKRTLVIDLENPERIIRRVSRRIYEAINQRRPGVTIDAHLLLKPDGVNLLHADHRTYIRNLIEQVEPDIVFLGPLYKAYIDPGGQTAEAVHTQIAVFLDELRTEYDCAFWLEHHAPLGQGGSRDLRPFGSSVWSRWPEFGIAMHPDPTEDGKIDIKHFRGQRDERAWPETLYRGKIWPFEKGSPDVY